jgi:SAM-dependent methyltransferase
MTFKVTAAAYDSFMGRYSEPLAPLFADFAGVEAGLRVLDVGCGPGALTAELARHVGPEQVAAVDPAEQFAAACRARVPGADVRQAAAERLPFDDGAFDAAYAQLVVGFMRDPDAGVAEMCRVVRPGGTLAICMWSSQRMELLQVFWRAAAVIVDPDAPKSEGMRFRTREELEGLAAGAGLEDVRTELLDAQATYDDFDEFWASIETGTGPAGGFYARLDDDQKAALREQCRRDLGDPRSPFTLTGSAWALRGRTPSGRR